MWRTVLIVFVVLFIVLVPAILARLSFWKIKNIEVNNNATISGEAIRSSVEGKLAGSYYYLFPRSNILLYPKEKIENDLKVKFPRIESVTVSMKAMDTIVVNIMERKPVAEWCTGEAATDGGCYFLDNTGLVIDKSPTFTKNVYTTYFGNLVGNPVGHQYVSANDFNDLQNFVETLKTLSLVPVSVEANPDNDYTLTLSGGEVILFTLRQKMSNTISNLESVLTDPKLVLRSSTGLSVSSLDLRYGNKVFYKKKGN